MAYAFATQVAAQTEEPRSPNNDASDQQPNEVSPSPNRDDAHGLRTRGDPRSVEREASSEDNAQNIAPRSRPNENDHGAQHPPFQSDASPIRPNESSRGSPLAGQHPELEPDDVSRVSAIERIQEDVRLAQNDFERVISQSPENQHDSDQTSTDRLPMFIGRPIDSAFVQVPYDPIDFTSTRAPVVETVPTDGEDPDDQDDDGSVEPPSNWMPSEYDLKTHFQSLPEFNKRYTNDKWMALCDHIYIQPDTGFIMLKCRDRSNEPHSIAPREDMLKVPLYVGLVDDEAQWNERFIVKNEQLALVPPPYEKPYDIKEVVRFIYKNRSIILQKSLFFKTIEYIYMRKHGMISADRDQSDGAKRSDDQQSDGDDYGALSTKSETVMNYLGCDPESSPSISKDPSDEPAFVVTTNPRGKQRVIRNPKRSAPHAKSNLSSFLRSFRTPLGVGSPGGDDPDDDGSSSSSGSSDSEPPPLLSGDGDRSSSESEDSSHSSSKSSDDSNSSNQSMTTPRSQVAPHGRPVKTAQKTTRKKAKNSSTKKTRSAHKIFYELTKSAERFNLPRLSSHTDPKRRRFGFLNFMESLQNVTNMTRETSKCLRDMGSWRSPRTKSASQAVFWLLSAYVDRTLRTSLNELYKEINTHDGMQALQLLQGLCAPQDEDERHNSFSRFQSITIEEGETIQQFNARFNRLASLVFASGKTLSSAKKLRQYFRALQLHPSSHIMLEVERWKRKYEEGSSVSLAYVQLLIQRHEEKLFPNMSEVAYKRPQRPRFKSGQRDSATTNQSLRRAHSRTSQRASSNASQTQRTSHDHTAVANATQGGPVQRRNRGCFGCGKEDHLLKNCPTTTPSDRNRIWEERKQRYNNRRNGNGQLRARANHARRIAFVNMMLRASDKPNRRRARERQRWRQSKSKHLPRHTRQVDYVNGYPVIEFGRDVILDSGASDHMTGDLEALDSIEPFLISVMMPDGHIVHCDKKGTMRLRVTQLNGDNTPIIPLVDTLHVPGLRSHLVSIPSLNKSGVEAQFSLDKAVLFVNGHKVEILDPYHRNPEQHPMPFAHNVDSPPPDLQPPSPQAAQSPTAKDPPPVKVHIELMHRRMGHRSFKSIIAAQASKVWRGVNVIQSPDDYCVDCKIGGITKAKRGAKSPSSPTRPGQVLFIDIIPNPAKGGLTSASSFPFYLIIVDAFSRYFTFIGLHGKSSSDVSSAIEEFAVSHRPTTDFSLTDVMEVHGDSDSAFMSEEFIKWGQQHGILVVGSAPHHQEMNGLPERLWQTTRVMAFVMLTHARLGLAFFHFALMYAWMICVVLPAKSTTKQSADGESEATTPYYLYFQKEPDVRKYRVFGCPVICKVYTRKDSSQRILDHKNIVQRGVRGVFVGFPVNQAGWLVFVPASRHLLASADVSFDEDFSSVSALPDRVYHDSLPIHGVPQHHDSSEPLAHTGPPQTNANNEDAGPWTPFTALDPDNQADEPLASDMPATDSFTPGWFDVEEVHSPAPRPAGASSEDESEGDSTASSSSTNESDDESPPEDPSPSLRSSPRFANAISYARHVSNTTTGDSSIMENVYGEPGMDPTPFLPEPRDVRQVIRLPVHIKRAWQKSFVKEIKGLIVAKKVFAKEDPGPDDAVVPLMCVFKCKLDKFGMIDKLKSRGVFRGDLYTPTDGSDSWNPHATWVGLKVFLGWCARVGTFPIQIDYVMAYVQARMRERVFALIPDHWKELLPEELHSWCGWPLLMLKALYGYTFSGKFLYEEQADFLQSQGFRETMIVALWKKTFEDGSIILVLQYSDDFLAAGTATKHMEDFKKALSERFDVNISPRADWYLQARIRQDADGNIILDQQRYSKSIVRRYIPNAAVDPTPDDIRRYRSPLPGDFKWTKSDNSTNAKEVASLEKEYGFRFIEVVGSLNYLANTATEELFAIRKACRHMNLPGRQHFRAILHLLHHLRCHPVNALVFYKDWSKSPVYKMLTQDLRMEIQDGTILWFTDASHADCDESRSTCCYVGFFQGGVVDMQSFVPQPVPHSTAESETMALAVGTMACSYVRMGIADILFDDPDRPWTIPVMSDSSAAIAMNNNSRPTRRSRHIDRRWFYARSEVAAGRIILNHVGADYSLADTGTKNLTAEESAYKLSLMELPVTDHALGPSEPSEEG